MRLTILLTAALLGCAAAAQAPTSPSEPLNPDEKTVPNLCIINTRDFLVRRSPEYLKMECSELAAETRERMAGGNFGPLICWYADPCSREVPLAGQSREVPVR